MLVWGKQIWLIDHGSALYVHHLWRDPAEHARRPFEAIRDHVLLPFAAPIETVDAALAGRLDASFLDDLVEAVPQSLLSPERGLPDAAAHRRAYVDYLTRRLKSPRPFVAEAERARAA